MNDISCLYLHFENETVLPLLCLDGEIIVSPTLGKVFEPGTDTLAWVFGRHPRMCDVLWDYPASAVHMTIFYDRSRQNVAGQLIESGEWKIKDGGYITEPLKMVVPPGAIPPPHYDPDNDERTVGYHPSTQGTFLNGERLRYTQPTEVDARVKPEVKVLQHGDRVFAAGHKIYISFLPSPPLSSIWNKSWLKSEPMTTISDKHEKEMVAEQQRKEIKYEESNFQTAVKTIDRRLNNANIFEKFLIYAAIAAIVIILLVRVF